MANLKIFESNSNQHILTIDIGNNNLNLNNIDNDDLIDINYDHENSYIIINNLTKIFLNNSETTINITDINSIQFYIKNLEIDINPKLLILEYEFTFNFQIKLFPIYLNLIYISSYDTEILTLLAENIK